VVGNTGGNYNADGDSLGVPMTPSFGSHLSGKKKADFLAGVFPGGKSAFAAPTFAAAGTEGNLGRNTYDNLGYNKCDTTVGKFFSTPWFSGEKLKFEAKGELYNVFNRSNLITLDVNMPDSNFGKATGQLPARSLQMQLRASF
jgi:hypothetical protein